MYSPSGIQKSVIIPNLASNTNYVFTITASDATGNVSVNSPIVLNATTSMNLECSGNDTVATEGSFTLGYDYTFQTIGTDVKITFELLDSKVGLVAFLRKQTPFTETQMTNVSGQIFTQTITGQTLGSTINYAVKFAYAGGLSVTKYVSYVVGSSCSLGLETPSESIEFYFPNPASEFVNITSNSILDKVEIYSLLGTLVSKTTANTNSIDISNLSKGIYLITVYSDNKKSIKKMIVN